MRIALIFLIGAASAWAQLNGPTLGYIPDGSSLRPMYGLPGAAALGDSVPLGMDLSVIATAAGQNYALATASNVGQALLILNGAATPIRGVDTGAARIAMSPTGSSAAFWFSAGHFQIVTGLPSAPAVRDLDASFLKGAPTSFAISDNGQSLAGSWESGGWLFNANGATALPVNLQINAIAFLPQQSTILAATTENVLSISNGAVATIYDWSHETESRRPLPAVAKSAATGIASSFDGRSVVMANRTGSILTIDLASGTTFVSHCGCTPDGVFSVGGSAFRLTSPAAGEVKIFDASTGSTFVVPPMLSSVTPQLVKHSMTSSATAPALPAVTIGGIPTTTGYQQQPSMTISLASVYSLPITGTVTLTFASSVGGDDQMIQFVSPAAAVNGRTATFTIPAGSTQASFAGSSSLTFDTGTVAGTITFTLDLMASGTDVTPSPAPKATYTTNPTVPFISTVTLEQTTGGVTVVVTGFSSTRDMTNGSFQFAAASGTTISNPTVAVSVASAFSNWYSNTASNAYGSQFTLTVPFPVTGQAGDLVAVTATLTNSKGGSNPVSQ